MSRAHSAFSALLCLSFFFCFLIRSYQVLQSQQGVNPQSCTVFLRGLTQVRKLNLLKSLLLKRHECSLQSQALCWVKGNHTTFSAFSEPRGAEGAKWLIAGRWTNHSSTLSHKNRVWQEDEKCWQLTLVLPSLYLSDVQLLGILEPLTSCLSVRVFLFTCRLRPKGGWGWSRLMRCSDRIELVLCFPKNERLTQFGPRYQVCARDAAQVQPFHTCVV